MGSKINAQLLNKFVRFSFFALIIAGLALLLGNKSWWPSFYTPFFYGWAFLTSAGLIILPKYIFRTKDKCRRETLILLQAAIALALVLNALGELYLYKLYQYGIQYDKFLHFTNSFLLVVVIASFLEIWYELPFKKALGFAALAVIAGSFLWEVIEYSSDLIFKTSEFGVYGQYMFSDTLFDLLSDGLGVILSSVFLLAPEKRQARISEYCHSPLAK